MTDYDFIDPDLPEKRAEANATEKLLKGDPSRFLVDRSNEDESDDVSTDKVAEEDSGIIPKVTRRIKAIFS